MKLMFRRILAFLAQTFIWLPLAGIINICAVSPFFMLSGDMGEPTNIFIFLPIMWAIAFGLNKFRQWLKGRQTDEYYDVAYDEVTVSANADYYSDTIRITEDHNYYTRTESSNTFWGWVGVILSFVALPLQLVAWLMSFAALFFPFIYSTARKLPEDRNFSFINVLLHTLFDFVFIKVNYKRENKASPMGILYSLLFLTVPIVDTFIWILIGGALETFFGAMLDLDVLVIILVFALFFMLLSIIMLWIKYSGLIIMSCSKREAKGYMRKLGRLSMIFGAMFALLIMFA